ncbi:MAG: sugar ABC transporter permease [Propionibacteriaceae bacterium]|jgi:arabinogalactan oligomer/maltooligosaccharide transport system permease protein|nr:sugar ABC transporter permease [Propionibacteriaceae bacterium]
MSEPASTVAAANAAQPVLNAAIGGEPIKGEGGSLRTRRVIGDILSHVFLVVLSIMWLVPIIWVLAESFNAYTGQTVQTFFPTEYTLDNYIQLFTDTSQMNFLQMFLRTLVIAIFVCAIQVFFVLSVAYCMSRLRFKLRKPFMNGALIIGMFPGIMSAVAIYFLLKAMGLTESVTGTTIGLIIVYAAGAGAGFYVMKGFMDTIPMSLDEAAMLDGCTKWEVFAKIILPITKPMIVYQAITAFLVPWLDYVLAKVVVLGDQGKYTVALGMYQMLQREYIARWYARFAAAAVCVSIPIAVLFIIMQRFYQASMSGSVKG